MESIITKNRLLELYAKYVWPFARHFVSLAKRCRNCILSERYGPLTNGLCKACSEQRTSQINESPEVGEEIKRQFDQSIQSGIGRNTYDALLLLSGGKDSAYILHRLKSEYPALKILCVFVNNGFSSPVALEGARFIAEKTKTDLIISNSRIDEFAAAFRAAFLSLNGRGSYGIVDFADGKMIFETGQIIAQGLGIPMVIGGLSWVQVQMIVGKDDFRLSEDSQPTIVFPLAVWRPNEQTIREIVRSSKLLPPGNESPIVSNNSLILAMTAIDVLNNGYCSFEPEFAQLVREGKADRNTWLHLFELLEFATTRGYLKREIEGAMQKLNISLTDLIKEKP